MCSVSGRQSLSMGVRLSNPLRGGSLDGSEFAFAYQGGGLRYVINTAWDLEAEYRFFGTPDVELEVRHGSRTVTAAEIPNEHSSFLVGLSYQF